MGKSSITFYSKYCLAVIFFALGAMAVQASSLTAMYYSMATTDPDVGNNQGQGAMVTTVGEGLGPSGLPVVNTLSIPGSLLHDVNPTTNELTWWTPAMNNNVTILNNPVYTSPVSLPILDDYMYTNTTILAENGEDSGSFLTAQGYGQFTLSSPGSIGFNVCSDDDSFVYISGGAFGSGTLVMDNGGLHGTTCSGGNVNTALLNDAAAGTYDLYVFYADRQQSGATFSMTSTIDLGPLAPEPGALSLLGVGLGLIALQQASRWRIRRGRS